MRAFIIIACLLPCAIEALAYDLHASGKLQNDVHYGNPKGGCLPDERNVTIEGVGGDLCSPICHPNASVPCPLDLPVGVTANPKCELEYKDGSKGCVLVCSPSSTNETSLRAGDKQCGKEARCQPIQNVGVCTYGGPAPSGLPEGCSPTSTSIRSDNKGYGRPTANTAGLVCKGNVSPEPGCEKLNLLCCANQLNESFSKILQYREKHPFEYFSMTCSGNFGGADAEWASQFGGWIQKMKGLTGLRLDLSFNAIASDALVSAIEPALNANPGLRNLSLILESSNITDIGAAHLGRMLEDNFQQGTSLLMDLSRNDPGEVSNMHHPVTAEGVGKVAAGIGTLKSLKNLSLNVAYDTNVTAKGMSYIANGIAPLKDRLEHLALNMGFMDIKPSFPANQKPNRYFACLAKTIASFSKLETFVINTDSGVNDPSTVQVLGIHLSCLPISRVKFPGMDSQGDCHCGISVDAERECLTPNNVFSGSLGHGCFKCMANANKTACEE